MASLDAAVPGPATDEANDAAAIEYLHRVLAAQKQAFATAAYPSLGERRSNLQAIAAMVIQNRGRIREAMSADFSVHPELFTDLIEVLGVAARAAYVGEQLEGWMAPEERFADPTLFGSGRAAVCHQPKGVIGNLVPWNFPFELSLGPLVDMLGAGNRVVIKPSEYTPACAELLDEMVSEVFDRSQVAVVTGGLELAKVFPTLGWDHLLYTGNPEVGRSVARAAAENLVPVTLELGGKNPVLLLEGSVDTTNVGQILGTKLIKNGQMGISADYCLVPRDQVDIFVSLAQAHVADRIPDYSSSKHCTGIISERHLDRLVGLLEEADEAGCHVVQLDAEGAVDRESRRMPLHLVVDPDDNLGIMREEIFGPILPIKPYDSVDEAIAYINDGERPPAIYVFSPDWDAAEQALTRTTSGGACINTCSMHGALPALGFGGIGTSGSGRHHGIDGFREFSNARGVLVRGEGDLIDAFFPPYEELASAVVQGALGP